MARDTMATKQARMVAYREAEQAKLAQAFPSNLLVALQGSAKFNFETEFTNNQLVVTNRDSGKQFLFGLFAGATALKVEWTEENQLQLDNLEFDVHLKAEAQRQADRRQALRESAFAKLTDEEVDALGL